MYIQFDLNILMLMATCVLRSGSIKLVQKTFQDIECLGLLLHASLFMINVTYT